MVKAFMGIADFSRMSFGNVVISYAIHKAFINVHEASTEAAAATAIGGETKGPPEEMVGILCFKFNSSIQK